MATSLSSNIANQLKKNLSNSLSNVGKNIVQNMANNAKQNATQIIADSIVKNAKNTNGASSAPKVSSSDAVASSVNDVPTQSANQNNSAMSSAGDVVSNAGNTESTTVNNTSAYKNTQDYIDDLNYVNAAADRRQSALDRLTEANYQTLREQQNQVKPTYDAARNSAYTASRISALGNNEYLANQGLAGNAYQSAMTGYSESARIQNDIALQNNLNYLNEQERSTVQALANAIRSAQNEYNLNRESIEQDREDMIYKLNSSYRDAANSKSTTEETDRLSTLNDLYEQGYELSVSDMNDLIKESNVDASYWYQSSPSNYVDYVMTYGGDKVDTTLFANGLAQKGYTYIDENKNRIIQTLGEEGYNKLVNSSSYKLSKAINDSTYQIEGIREYNKGGEVVLEDGTKTEKTHAVNLTDNERAILKDLYSLGYTSENVKTNLSALAMEMLTYQINDGAGESDFIDKVAKLYGVDANALGNSYYGLLKDIKQKHEQGKASETEEWLFQQYSPIMAKLDTIYSGTDNTYKDVVYLDDGRQRIFGLASSAKTDDNGRKLKDVTGRLSQRNLTIEFNDKKYYVEVSKGGTTAKKEGTSTKAKDGSLTISGDAIWVLSGNTWYKLQARSNEGGSGNDYGDLKKALEKLGAFDI